MVGRLPIGLLMYICKAHPIVLKLFPILVTHWLPWPWGCSCAHSLPFQYRLAYTVSIKTICFYLDKQASLAVETRLLFATSTRSAWSPRLAAAMARWLSSAVTTTTSITRGWPRQTETRPRQRKLIWWPCPARAPALPHSVSPLTTWCWLYWGFPSSIRNSQKPETNQKKNPTLTMKPVTSLPHHSNDSLFLPVVNMRSSTCF